MGLSRQTMTDEQRKSVVLEYLKAFDNGGVTSDGGSILDLFYLDPDYAAKDTARYPWLSASGPGVTSPSPEEAPHD